MHTTYLDIYISQKIRLCEGDFEGKFQTSIQAIPNGCLDAYEVKVNNDISKYQEKVKLISQFQRFKKNFNSLLEFASFP